MEKTVNQYLSELLQQYQQITQKTCIEMAVEFDITLSNLYLYRNEQGNPRAKTIDKILGEISLRCPRLLGQVLIH